MDKGNKGDVLKINQDFAQKFTYMKKREAIEKGKAKYGKDYVHQEEKESESDNESEDSEAGMINEKVMTKFIETYIKLKDGNLAKEFLVNKDPVFNDEDFVNENKKKKADKIQFSVNDALMEYTGQDIVEEGEDNIYSVGYETKKIVKEDKEKTEFLKKLDEDEVEEGNNPSNEEEGDFIDDGFLKVKPNSSIVVYEDTNDDKKEEKVEEDFENLGLDQVMAKARIKPKGLNTDLLGQIWGDDKNLDKNEKFLRNYILSEAWLENEEHKINKKLVLVDREDEDKDEQFDEYEFKYNHRFEEEGGANITTYQRNIPDSYRIKDDSRSQKRKDREIRKEEETKKIRTELQKANDVKKEEIKKKMQLIEKVAGTDRIKEIIDELEDEFDPVKFDEKMNKIFNAEYYENKDREEDLKDCIEEKGIDYKSKIPNDEEEVEGEVEDNYNGDYNEQYDEGNYGEDGEELPREQEWFYCDECKKVIKENKIKYECEKCDDYILCRDCYKSVNHSHKMKKDKVPMGFKAPENWKDIIENVTKEENADEANLNCTNCTSEIITSYYFKCSEEECSSVKICKTCRGIGKSIHEHKLTKFIIEEEPVEEEVVTPKDKMNLMLDNVYNAFTDTLIAKEIATKFHYTKVDKDDLGITDEMLIYLDDKTLNKFIPLKRLAPYREKNTMNDWQKKKMLSELTKEVDRRKLEIARTKQITDDNIERNTKMLSNKRKPVKSGRKKDEAVEDYKKKKRLETYGIES